MKKILVDVVNFNADASCLSSKGWLDILEGGKDSALYQWASLYLHHKKKVVLGFPGSTAADIFNFNKEVIDLINKHPDIFEIIIRPYAHDISLLRSSSEFIYNFELGKKTLCSLFSNVHEYYLPPEFMCNTTQISLLKDHGIKGVFINPGRYEDEISLRIPTQPYQVLGLMGDGLPCVPFVANLTAAYLDSIHNYEALGWNKNICSSKKNILYSWRDGESPFLLPNSVARERSWLESESDSIERQFVSDMFPKEINIDKPSDEGLVYSYPIHSFSAWVKEMKMFWFISEVQGLSRSFDRFSLLEKSIWLQLISSDILSSVEKKSPVISLKLNALDKSQSFYTIYRKDKAYEGEEYLNFLKNMSVDKVREYMLESNLPHVLKLRTRYNLIKVQNADI